MSPGCEMRSLMACGLTKRIPSRPGEATARGSRRTRQVALGSPLRRYPLPGATDRSLRRPAANGALGRIQHGDAWGQTYCPNIPTEEVATTPDWRRTHGVVTTTIPFADVGASFTFDDGRLVSASATQGEAWLRQMLETDRGASKLGELALVPSGNRLAELGRTYFHGLFDENVASHVAFGRSYTETVPGADDMTEDEREAAGMAISSVHHDFMIGGAGIDVFGISRDGGEEAIMVRGNWHTTDQ
jgi:aminopeptidase